MIVDLGAVYREGAKVDEIVAYVEANLPRALAPGEVAGTLGMDKLRGHAWHVQGCNARVGDGLFEGMDWLAATLKAKK